MSLVSCSIVCGSAVVESTLTTEEAQQFIEGDCYLCWTGSDPDNKRSIQGAPNSIACAWVCVCVCLWLLLRDTHSAPCKKINAGDRGVTYAALERPKTVITNLNGNTMMCFKGGNFLVA